MVGQSGVSVIMGVVTIECSNDLLSSLVLVAREEANFSALQATRSSETVWQCPVNNLHYHGMFGASSSALVVESGLAFCLKKDA